MSLLHSDQLILACNVILRSLNYCSNELSFSMFALTVVYMTDLEFRLNFMAGSKRLYIMMQENVKTGILPPFDANIIAKNENKRQGRGIIYEKLDSINAFGGYICYLLGI